MAVFANEPRNINRYNQSSNRIFIT